MSVIERRVEPAALLVMLLLAVQSTAIAGERLVLRDDHIAPRDIFFSDYFLFSAQADIVRMKPGERSALRRVLDICADTLSATEASRRRCELETQQYLMDFRQLRRLDRLLDAVQFMSSMFQYNKIIGRQNEAGLHARQTIILRGLRDALRMAGLLAETEHPTAR